MNIYAFLEMKMKQKNSQQQKHKESIKELNHLFMNVYRNQNTENTFYNMVQQQLEKKGLLLEIEKRDDVLINTFKSSNHSNPIQLNENRQTIHVIR